jgi:hypothetical protein
MNYGETLGSAMSRVAREFRPGLAELRLEVLEASGLLGRWQEDFPAKRDAALQEIQDTAVNASADIRKKAADAVAEFEAAKAMSNKISVGDAQTKFSKAAASLKTKSRVCFS